MCRTVGQLMEQWLEGPVAGFRESSQMAYRLAVEKHILPALGEIALDCLDGEQVERWIEGLRAKGLSHKTVREINAKLTAALRWGVERGELEHCSFCVRLRAPTPQKACGLSVPEKERLEQQLLSSGTQVEMGILLALWCGLAAGEVCALRWIDVGLGRITVKGCVQRVADTTGQRKTCVKWFPQKERTVPLPEQIRPLLDCLRGEDDKFLLTGKGRPMEPRVLQVHWKRVAERCGIRKELTFSALQATYISGGFRKGLTPTQLGRLTGRKGEGRLWERYGESL